MYPVSTQFQTAATAEHTAVSKCEVWEGDTYLATLDLIAGQVTADSSRTIRSAFSCTLASEELVPKEATDLLYPATAELRPYRGIMIGGTPQYTPLGVFGFDDLDVHEGPNGLQIDIEANDRAAKYARATSVDTLRIDTGTDPIAAIEETLLETGFAVEVRDLTGGAGGFTTSQVVNPPGTDLWASALRIAQAVGKQLYLNRDGIVVLDNVPDPNSGDFDLVYDMDSPGAPVINFTRTVSAVNTYNGVVASGEGTDLVRPLTATAWNNDSNSPYYYLGAYGAKPFFYTSPMLLTLAQCKEAAAAMLRRIVGATETMNWAAVPNPALDVYDLIHFKRDRAGVDDIFVVESVTYPLNAETPMQASGRNMAQIVVEDTS